MAVVGIPQYDNVRFLLVSGSAGTEVDIAFVNGQDQSSWPPFNAAGATHTITKGPTTTGPVEVTLNGVKGILPFNGGNLTIPKWMVDCLQGDGTGTAGTPSGPNVPWGYT